MTRAEQHEATPGPHDPLAQLFDQPRLADPGFARHERETAIAFRGRVPRIRQ